MKNVISQMISATKAHVKTAEQSTSWYGPSTFDAEQMVEMANAIVEGEAMSVTDFEWEFQGGDALPTSKLVSSLLWSSYQCLTRAILAENGYWDVKSHADKAAEQAIREALGFPDPDDDGFGPALDVNTALAYAKAAFIYANHIARFKGGDYRWLLSMDIKEAGETRTVSQVVPFTEWANRQATSKEVGETWQNAHAYARESKEAKRFLEQLPGIDEAKLLVQEYLGLENPDGIPRGLALIERAADRRFKGLVEALIKGDLKRATSQAAVWELILMSPLRAQMVASYKASREYRLSQMEKDIAEAERLEAKAEEEARLDALEAELKARLARLKKAEGMPAQANPALVIQDKQQVRIINNQLNWERRKISGRSETPFPKNSNTL
jgi:hypothetical protein